MGHYAAEMDGSPGPGHTDKAKAWDAIAAKNAEIARLRAALESLTEDPPATLDEPDPDWEVIIKMRNIAREALGLPHGPTFTNGDGGGAA